MKNSRVSISHIAKEVGVSPSTVSRALNGNPAISEKSRKLIIETANRLNYVPNTAAIKLQSGVKNSIGLIIPIIGRNFFASAIEGIEDYAYEHGYDVIICQSKDSSDREEHLVNSLKGKVDGIIASLAAEDSPKDYYNSLHDIHIPLVLFDRIDSTINASTISVDDFKGAKAAVEHLLSSGRKRIYHFGSVQNIQIWRDRKEGYLAAMKESGITPPDDWIHIASPIREEGRIYAKNLMKSNNPLPDAIFFTGDYAALGAMLEFKERGIRVPQDIAIVGFANERFCQITTPPITSVEQFSYRMGQQACKLLFERLKGGAEKNIVIEPKLIIRESSR